MIVFLPRKNNSRANLISKLASTKRPDHNRIVIQETLIASNTEKKEVNTIYVTRASNWMTPIICYLTIYVFNWYEVEEKRIKKLATKYNVVARKIYKMGMASSMQRCLGEDEITMILMEVHERVCKIHIGGWALAHKPLRAGFYWPSLIKDIIEFFRKCDKCQRHSNLHHASVEVIHSATSS